MFVLIHSGVADLNPQSDVITQLLEGLAQQSGERVEVAPLGVAAPPAPIPEDAKSPLGVAAESEASRQSLLAALIQRSEEQMRVAADLFDSARDLRDDLRRLQRM